MPWGRGGQEDPVWGKGSWGRGAVLLEAVETWGASSLPQWRATGLAPQPQGSLRKSQLGLPPGQAAGAEAQV